MCSMEQDITGGENSGPPLGRCLLLLSGRDPAKKARGVQNGTLTESESSRISDRVGGTSTARDGREAGEERCLLADAIEHVRACKV